PICLPPEDTDDLSDRNATITGWGRLSEGGERAAVLKEANVPIVSNKRCEEMFKSVGRHEAIPEILMCAGYDKGGPDSCNGDSGGPLQVQDDEGHWFLAGIVSWGIGCGEPSQPGVYTLIQLNHDINGKWFKYLSELWELWSRRLQYKTNRITTHDVWKDEVHNAGMMPFPHEWHYDVPSQDKNEDLLIYGVNSSKQSIYIAIKWRPKGVDNQMNATISLRFDDNNSNSYTLEEVSEVEYRKNEYRICGLGVEIMSPFRRKRIKFRGYLKKNNNELVYVRFRFLWYAVSRVYDFTHDFDDHFMAKELLLSPKSRGSSDRFEDRFEQFGQMKGNFKEEMEEERQLYFWGSELDFIWDSYLMKMV
ncbi:unnamed protein product, partial [Oppiella nova]